MVRAPFPTTPHAPRRDVQALRALAVAVVLAYHVGAPFSPAGFIGVDVFFVVSGFLITGLLARELESTGRIRLRAFWARRARRLLPASLLVLLVTAVAVWLVAPREDWLPFFQQISAATLYVQNWALAAASVDYLAAEGAASPVQHFWSLAVEEQFYLLWPLLLLAAVGLLRSRRLSRVLVGAVAGVTLASLVWSLAYTASDPAPAYFATTARAWEFGAGALVALAPRWGEAASPRLRAAAAWIGWAGIATSAILVDPSAPYPGTAALLPVLATVLVLTADADGLPLSPSRLVSLAPVQRLGDISYALYLWHWPLIVLLPLALDVERDAAFAVVVLAASLVLAVVTTRAVEDPLRHRVLPRLPSRRALALGAAATAIVLGVSASGWGGLLLQVDRDRAVAADLAAQQPDCFGAPALVNPGCPVEPTAPITPSTATAEQDVTGVWDSCESRDTAVRSCTVGEPGGVRVLLVGDSHAHHWDAAVERLAVERGWEVHLMFTGGCPFAGVSFDRSPSDVERCAAWNASVESVLADERPYALVITSMRASENQLSGADAAVRAEEGFRRSWQPLIDRGATVVALRDTPEVGAEARGCVDANPGQTASCAIETERGLGSDDLLFRAAGVIEGAVAVDTSGWFCRDGECPAVVGNVLVNRDSHHLTATYARTLAPALGVALDRALAEADQRSAAPATGG